MIGEFDLKNIKKIIFLLLIVLLSLSLISCAGVDEFLQDDLPNIDKEQVNEISEDGVYSNKEDVALYIHTYGKLPNNFIRKKEAEALGWKSNKGNLWDVTEKKSIGGDRFGNREGNLPKKDGRQYYEADINYEGEYRGAERIVYSNDGLIYYTEDHYDTFTLLYGDD